jgi:nucleotide-binding universal stress UspA family protein
MDAAREAEVLARHFHSEVTVLHVVDPREHGSGHFEPGGAKVSELGTVLARGFSGATIRQIVCNGDPTRNILDFTRSNHVDLVVMASHGYGPFRRFLMGSVTAEVQRKARCPVWVSAHVPQESPMFRTVLCAMDLRSPRDSIVDWAREFSAEFMARLNMVHVVRGLESSEKPYFPGDSLSPADTEELGKVRQKVGNEGQIYLVGGDVPEAVCSQAKRLHADLLVIGRRPKACSLGTAHTTSLTIVHESPCSVVSV